MNPVYETLIRSVLKVGSGALIAKGLVDDASAEVAIGAIVTLISVIWGVVSRRRAAASAEPVKIHQVPVLAVAAGLLLLGAGCSTTGTAGRLLATTVQTVDLAMQGWAQYVVSGQVTPEQETAVRAAYAQYQLAEQAAEAAYLAAARTGDLDPWRRAAASLRASQAVLLALIDQCRTKP